MLILPIQIPSQLVDYKTVFAGFVGLRINPALKIPHGPFFLPQHINLLENEDYFALQRRKRRLSSFTHYENTYEFTYMDLKKEILSKSLLFMTGLSLLPALASRVCFMVIWEKHTDANFKGFQFIFVFVEIFSEKLCVITLVSCLW